MRRPLFQQPARAAILISFCFIWAICLVVRGDQVEMVNGDRYVGHVMSLGSDTLVLQNEFLGTVKLPRARISMISLETQNAAAATNSIGSSSLVRSNSISRLSPRTSAKASPQFDAAISQLSANSNIITQVQQQFLAGAGPEAQAKFNDLVTGLLNGSLGVNDLRSEAKKTLDQARSARKELGEEGGSSLDSYLAILEGFLKETEPSVDSTNGIPSAASAKLKGQNLSQEQ
jgi:hypothetical protein